MKRIKIFGRSIPAWLLVLTLIASGLGAVVGTVLAGQITGRIPVTVGQALLVEPGYPTTWIWSEFTDPPRSIATRSDDGTGFSYGAEVYTGDQFGVEVRVKNHSAQDLVGELSLTYPEGLSLDLSHSEAGTSITRIALYSWKFKVPAGTLQSLIIAIAVADDIDPGFYNIEGTIKQVAY